MRRGSGSSLKKVLRITAGRWTSSYSWKSTGTPKKVEQSLSAHWPKQRLLQRTGHDGQIPKLRKRYFDRQNPEVPHLLAEWKNMSQNHIQSSAESSIISLEVIKSNMTKFHPGPLKSLQYNQSRMVYFIPRNRETFRKKKDSKGSMSGKEYAFHTAEESDTSPLQFRLHPKMRPHLQTYQRRKGSMMD